MLRFLLALILVAEALQCRAETLTAERLGIAFNQDDAASARVAAYYASRRGVPANNVIGLRVPDRAVISRDELARLRAALLTKLPSDVQSLLLVWARPYAVECMSITTAMAAGYQPGFCEPGCDRTLLSPLFDSQGWLPADTAGWLPAMLLPTEDEVLARAVIDRGIAADGSEPPGTIYLVRTSDVARNVRAVGYSDAQALLGSRIRIVDTSTPMEHDLPDALAYFTGVERVAELSKIHFRAGAVADHLTSSGGVLEGSSQMSALAWLRSGATASYGSVSEPCNRAGKFPSPSILLDHYLRGETLLEAYWKSVAMPGQGLFIGEPLARPYALRP